MESLLNKIKRLHFSIPENDIKHAEKFIENRNFDKLLELVESDIYLVQKNDQLELPKEVYSCVDIEDLLELQTTIIEYLSYLD